ncbi:hypothetical protein MIR68_001710 [Amoeboaphelidium protococcarum]|nr:hypothetical protein MIR68_001710 [Amoeboaphelidium protococcarum]
MVRLPSKYKVYNAQLCKIPEDSSLRDPNDNMYQQMRMTCISSVRPPPCENNEKQDRKNSRCEMKRLMSTLAESTRYGDFEQSQQALNSMQQQVDEAKKKAQQNERESQNQENQANGGHTLMLPNFQTVRRGRSRNNNRYKSEYEKAKTRSKKNMQ